jgi:hypothetical protein
MKGEIPFDLTTLDTFNVNRDGEPEVIYQPLYDIQAYPLAGFTGDLLFFQTPIGQAAKTLEDTNMRSAGRMPTPKNAALVAIEVFFRPAGVPSATGAIVAANWNDVNAVHGSRMSLTLRIGDKTYLEESPLGVMPMQFRVDGGAALSDTTTAAAARVTKIDYAAFCGPLYQIVPLRLIANQEFSVKITSPVLVPLPSGADGRIGVRLQALQYRLSQ